MFTLDPKLETAITSFEKGDKTEGMFFMNNRNEEDNLLKVIKVECEELSGVMTTEFGQSVLCKLVNSEDTKLFEEIEQEAKDLLPDNVIFKSFVLEDKFFLKLGIKDDKYKARITPSANPNQLDKTPFYAGASLEIEMNPNAWVKFSNDECHAGLFMNVNKVSIDGGKKKKKSK